MAGEEPTTAFGKACQKLNIEIIAAHSPQAKGRVERSNGTYQDRFLKELALRRITTCKTADKLLNNGFCNALNDKFAHPPLEQEDYHRPIPKELKLNDVFCFEEHRVLQNDWTIRYKNRYYQIDKDNTPLPKPKDKILLRTHLDGEMQLLYGDMPLAFRPVSQKELHQQPRQQKKIPVATAKTRPTTKPAQNHPWRQGCTLMRNETTR